MTQGPAQALFFATYIRPAVLKGEASTTNERSLAFIGSATATKRNCAGIFTALSITRLEGSCWCSRRTRWAMENLIAQDQ